MYITDFAKYHSAIGVSGTQNGARVLTRLNEKCSKIKGFRQSINGINLKIKCFFSKYVSILKIGAIFLP